MKKIKLTIINTILLIAILCYLVIGSAGSLNEDKEAYVVTNELFNQFDYQIELDQEFKSIKDNKLKELEALELIVLNLEKNARLQTATEENIALFQYRYQEYQQVEMTVNNELVEINNRYSLQVWDKLNAFITDFGEENNYEVIFGAGGNGNIMYAQEKKNITEELIAFCNLKYNGK